MIAIYFKRCLLEQINDLPDKLVLEVYELADFKRGSKKIQSGCPTWIRTMNNASKGRCVTITPSDKPHRH